MYVVGLSRGLRRPPAPSSPRQRPPIVAHGSTPDRIKEWLLATGDEFVNLDGSIQLIMEKQKSEIFKICSDHFTSDMIVKSERRTRLVLMAKPTIFVKAKVLQTLHDMTLRRAENSSDIEMLDLSAPSADRSASTEGHSAPSEDLGAPSEDLGAPSEDLGAPSEDLGAPSEDLGAQSETSIYDHEYIAGFHYKLAFDKSFMNIATNTTNLTMIAKGVSTSKYYGRRSRSTQTHSVIQTSDVSTNIIGLNPTKDVWTWTGPTEEFAGSIDNSPNAAIVQQTDTIKKVCTMPGAMPMETELLLSPNSQQSVPVENIDTPFSNISSITRVSEMDATLNVSEFNDPIYSPEEETTDIGDLTFLTEPSPEDYVSEKKFIVFETSLDLLIKKVQTCTFHEPCNAPITNTEKIISGTLLKVYTVCESNHRCEFWSSQPMIGNRSCGNLLASASILFSGSHFAKVAELFAIFGVPFISQSIHYIYQKQFLFPIIDHHYKKERRLLIDGLRGKMVCLSGDGQCDSPGFNAKYCTYSLLEEKSQKIIECQTIQVSDAKSSVAMESLAFKSCMDQVLADKILISILVTDRHVSIRKIMRERYKAINHQFDIWHYCRSIRLKLSTICRQAMYKELVPWQNSIINHMWAACSYSKGNPILLKEKWLSVMHHIINEHEWDSATLFKKCQHAEYDQTLEQKSWLKKNGVAYSKLRSFVTDSKLEKDFPHLVHFCHTGSLEVFHSLVLKYRPKRVHFTMDGMVARTQLAVLAHNANVGREQATIQKEQAGTGHIGDLRFKPFFSKRSKNWKIKKIYEKNTIAHIYPMMADVLRIASGDLQVNWQSQTGQLPINIASTPRPPKEVMVDRHFSRLRPRRL
ncbi:Hypothetical predicted protein [Pelobates cultripes]|uniref:THAP-type domain-containing protein n=1 Tax=Pelobates cultripes TaxID=61616 RepID=A0AAD1W4B2_PELCU|nr:Hypothetical predicted protein [Pelobates cultripes]